MIRKRRRHEGATRRDAYDVEHLGNGFATIRTGSDCGAFGQWTNPLTRTIVSYVEGDVTTTECDNDAELVAELERIRDWHQKREQDWIGIDTLDPALSEALARAGAGHLTTESQAEEERAP